MQIRSSGVFYNHPEDWGKDIKGLGESEKQPADSSSVGVAHQGHRELRCPQGIILCAPWRCGRAPEATVHNFLADLLAVVSASLIVVRPWNRPQGLLLALGKLLLRYFVACWLSS